MPKIRDLVENADAYREILRRKNAGPIIEKFDDGLKLYEQWKQRSIEMEDLRREVNSISKEFEKTRDKSLIEKSQEIKEKIKAGEQQEKELADEVARMEVMLPNMIADGVPDGGEQDAQVIGYRGTPAVSEKDAAEFASIYPGAPSKTVAHEPFHHYNLVGRYIDQETAGKVSSSRFYYEFDELAILDLALGMYTVEFFRNKGYSDKIMITPYMMRKDVEERITYFEAFQDTIFEVEKDNLLLIPSSEHSIIAYYEDSILDEESLPMRILAWSPCFRREAGSHGKDTLGIFRVKQFHKVELHSIVKEGEDFAELDRMAVDVCDFLDSLGLPNRSVMLAAGDMDKRALKQIDIETWMPGQARFRETHSIATVGTWVSEKLMIRYKTEKKKKILTRNLYATAAAVQRTICAIAENHYDPDAKCIRVPDALKKYTMGVETIPV
ncbi:MAG TPA: serine--tRNA ligase [bacterium]|nr:serine--tRNA ligase [bacterium]